MFEQPGVTGDETALERLLRQRHEQIIECHKLLATVRAAVARAITDYRDHGPAEPGAVVCLRGDAEIRKELLTLAAKADREMLTMLTRADWPGEVATEVRAAEMDALRRGVAIRRISPAASRYGVVARPRPGDVARRPAEPHHSDQRLAELLPADLVVVDRRAAIILLSPGSVHGTALLIDSPAMTALAATVFEQIWAGARAPDTEGRPIRTGQAGADEGAPSVQERILLGALGGGAKDEAAARQLGVSVRTARRMIADLMRRLEARSRFQAGAVAVQKGWL